MEGKIGHYFYPGGPKRNGHSNVVNLLQLGADQTKFLSGSWDKKILEWDLNGTGSISNEFKGANSELSSLEFRPLFSSVVVEDFGKPEEQYPMPSAEGDNKSTIGNGDAEAEEDDEMNSLFGDDEEEDEEMKDAVENIEDLNERQESKVAEQEDQQANINSPKTEKQDSKSPTNLSKSELEEISKSSLKIEYDESVFMTSGLNGSVQIWDRRINTAPVLNMMKSSTTPPWCQSACWGTDGDTVYAGRRNACVEEFSLRMPSEPKSTLKLPSISGPVTCIQSMPNNSHILCASRDNIRLFDIRQAEQKSKSPFLIVPGHHGGAISNIYVDPTCRFMISTSGNRGWQGTATDTTFIYEIDLE